MTFRQHRAGKCYSKRGFEIFILPERLTNNKKCTVWHYSDPRLNKQTVCLNTTVHRHNMTILSSMYSLSSLKHNSYFRPHEKPRLQSNMSACLVLPPDGRGSTSEGKSVTPPKKKFRLEPALHCTAVHVNVCGHRGRYWLIVLLLTALAGCTGRTGKKMRSTTASAGSRKPGWTVPTAAFLSPPTCCGPTA